MSIGSVKLYYYKRLLITLKRKLWCASLQKC